MIISKTPLRLSLVGGGTDIPYYYKKNGYGSVISSTINKYIYVTVKKQSDLFFEKYRLNYSETEIVENVKRIKNPIIREVLNFLNIDDSIYISTIADVPYATGLGSSSAFCVGLLNAIHYFKGDKISPDQLAEEASHIEIERLKKPIGKQDQYAAAFGGFNYFRFLDNGNVKTKKLKIQTKEISKLEKNSLLFWTGVKRSADNILEIQKNNFNKNSDKLNNFNLYTYDCYKFLNEKNIAIIKIGNILKKGWEIKKNLANSITNNKIDTAINNIYKNNAYGAKVLGAGGGGFIYLIAKNKDHGKIIRELKKNKLVKMDFRFTNNKSSVIKID